jgi:excisionase family DNA binding protein
MCYGSHVTEPVEPELLTPREAARRLAVGVDSLRRWEREGLLTSVRPPGGHRRYQPDAIDALASGKAGS